MQTIKLDDVRVDSKLQKEVDRVAHKYKNECMEHDVVGEGIITQDNEVFYQKQTISDEEIVDILKEL